MGQPSCMRSVVDRNVVKRQDAERITHINDGLFLSPVVFECRIAGEQLFRYSVIIMCCSLSLLCIIRVIYYVSYVRANWPFWLTHGEKSVCSG
jgi:hypothetical protein